MITEVIIGKNLLKTVGKPRTLKQKQRTKEAQRYIVFKQLIQYDGSDCLFFTVIGYNIRIFLNEVELVSGLPYVNFGEQFKFQLMIFRGVRNDPGQVSFPCLAK